MANARPTNPTNEQRQATDQPHGPTPAADPQPTDVDGRLGQIHQQLAEAENHKAGIEQELDAAVLDVADGKPGAEARSKKLNGELETVDQRIRDLIRASHAEKARLKQEAAADLEEAQQEHQEALEQLHATLTEHAERVDTSLDQLDEEIQRYRQLRATLRGSVDSFQMGMHTSSNDSAFEKIVGVRLGWESRSGEYANPERQRFAAHVVNLTMVQHRGHYDAPKQPKTAQELRADTERMRHAVRTSKE